MNRAGNSSDATAGFALVVALGLMAFLLLLLMGTASLVTVESRRGMQDLEEFKARQNAMLGLRIALAQLQADLGPDRRITARAEILELDETAAPQPQSRLWVGVWEPDGPPPNPMDPNTPVLRSWLTSASQAGVSASDALSDDDSVIIAGGFEYPDPDDPDKAYKDYDPVRVPLVSIAQPDTQSAGRYAYWVEDEGMKAKLNIVNPYLDDDPDSAEGRYRFMTSLRFGVEKISDLESLIDYHSADTPEEEQQRYLSLIMPENLIYLQPALDSGQQIHRQHRHNITLHSKGLLTNTRDGGLKIDLTRGFEEDAIADRDRVFRFDEGGNKFYGPAWWLFKNFYNLRTVAGGSGSSTPSIPPQLPIQGVPNQGATPKPGVATLGGYGSLETVDGVQITGWFNTPRILPVIVGYGITYSLHLVPFEPLIVNQIPSEDGGETTTQVTLNPASAVSDDELTIMQEIFEINAGENDNFFEQAPVDFSNYLRIIVRMQPVLVMANPYNVALDTTTYRVTINAGAGGGFSSGSTNPYNPDHLSPYPLRGNLLDNYGPSLQFLRPRNDNPNSSFNRNLSVKRFLPAHDTNRWHKRGDDQENNYGSGLYGLSVETAFEPGEIKIFVINDDTGDPDPDTGFITSSTLQLVEGTFADYISRSLEFPVPLWLGIGSNDSDTSLDLHPQTYPFDPIIQNEISNAQTLYSKSAWEQFLDTRLGLVRRSAAGGLFGINSSAKGNNRFEVRLMAPSPYDESSRLVSFIFTQPRNSSEPKRQIYDVNTEENIDVPLLHTTFRLKDSTIESQSIKPLISANLRSVHHGFFDAKDNLNVWMGWQTHSPLYVEVHDSDINYPFSPSILWEPTSDNENRMVLFHVPRERLFSIGDFQHLDVAWSVYAPTYAIGNSFAMPWIDSDNWFIEFDHTSGNRPNSFHYDHSYVFNRVLWDQYFFSTWPRNTAEIQSKFPLNRRIQAIPRDDAEEEPDSDATLDYIASLGHDELAGALFVDGAFNINSTSVEAWKAILASLNNQKLLYYDPVSDSQKTSDVHSPVMRSPYPAGGVHRTESPDNFWRGYRELTEEQIDNLAKAIVEQIKQRGPFLTLADFINRKLSTPGDPHSLCGPLQAAINATATNNLSWNSANPVDYTTETKLNLRFYKAFNGHRVEGGPGYITQADIVRVVGPILSARSDTFTIRAYGEATSPFGDTTASAWCEAVVQRIPDWKSDDPDLAPHNDPAEDALASRFGRQFRVLSFRWLHPNEI